MTSKSDRPYNFGVICRICLKGDGPMFSIFTDIDTENDTQPLLANRITSIAQIQISPGDGLPVSICQSCRQQVDKFYDFRLLVEISDRALRSYLDYTHGSQKMSSRPIEDTNDLDYQEFLVENNSADDTKDLFAVNAILVPSETDAEVWRICSVEHGNDETKQEADITKKETEIITDQNNAMEIVDSNKNDVTLVNGSFEQNTQSVEIIENVEDKKPLIFTETTEENDDCQKLISNDNKNITSVTIIDEIDNEDDEDSSLNKYNCQLCLKPFKSLKTLKTHVMEHFLHNKEKLGICEIEKRNVTLTRKFQNSNCKTPEKRIDDCTENNDVNPVVTSQTYELVFDRNEKILCVTEKKSKANNSKDEKSTKILDKEGESCENVCNDKNVKIRKLNDNNDTQGNNTSLTCDICQKIFRSGPSFKMHLKRHELGSRFNCSMCDKSYYSNSELARHMQLHTGSREYPCSMCEMSFLSKPELNRHTKYHRGEKRFECKICKNKYFESGHLKVHQRVHTGERPFPCSICEKGFITKSKLMRHFKIHGVNSAT